MKNKNRIKHVEKIELEQFKNDIVNLKVCGVPLIKMMDEIEFDGFAAGIYLKLIGKSL